MGFANPFPNPFSSKFASRPDGADGVEDPENEMIRFMWENSRLISPESLNKSRWDKLLFILALYFACIMPLYPCFGESPPVGLLVIDYLLDVLFMVDIGVTLRTSFFDQERELVVDRKLILHRYLHSGWLVVDAASSFPFEMFAAAGGESIGSAAFGVLRCARVARLFSMLRKPGKRSTGKIITNVIASQMGRVGNLLGGFLVVAHWTACFWWAIGSSKTNMQHGECGEYVGSLDDFEMLIACQRSTGLGVAWLLRPGKGGLILHADSPFSQKYLSSLYWALSTLMKTAWIGPDTVAEKVFAGVIVTLGAMIFALLLGNISTPPATNSEAETQKDPRPSTLTSRLAARGLLCAHVPPRPPRNRRRRKLVRQGQRQAARQAGHDESFRQDATPARAHQGAAHRVRRRRVGNDRGDQPCRALPLPGDSPPPHSLQLLAPLTRRLQPLTPPRTPLDRPPWLMHAPASPRPPLECTSLSCTTLTTCRPSCRGQCAECFCLRCTAICAPAASCSRASPSTVCASSSPSSCRR